MKYTVSIENQEYQVEIVDLNVRPVVVLVNGVTVEVQPSGEIIQPASRPVPVSTHPASAPAAQAPAAAQTAPPQASSVIAAGQNLVRAPIPGVIQTIFVKPGDVVTKGQELFIIEAMKMKNTIRSIRDGVIDEVLVAPGVTVNHNAPIVSYSEG